MANVGTKWWTKLRTTHRHFASKLTKAIREIYVFVCELATFARLRSLTVSSFRIKFRRKKSFEIISDIPVGNLFQTTHDERYILQRNKNRNYMQIGLINLQKALESESGKESGSDSENESKSDSSSSGSNSGSGSGSER